MCYDTIISHSLLNQPLVAKAIFIDQPKKFLGQLTEKNKHNSAEMTYILLTNQISHS